MAGEKPSKGAGFLDKLFGGIGKNAESAGEKTGELADQIGSDLKAQFQEFMESILDFLKNPFGFLTALTGESERKKAAESLAKADEDKSKGNKGKKEQASSEKSKSTEYRKSSASDVTGEVGDPEPYEPDTLVRNRIPVGYEKIDKSKMSREEIRDFHAAAKKAFEAKGELGTYQTSVVNGKRYVWRYETHGKTFDKHGNAIYDPNIKGITGFVEKEDGGNNDKLVA